MRYVLLVCVAVGLHLLQPAAAASLSDEIFSAARAGDSERVRAILKQSPRLCDARDLHQLTPLHAAAASLRATTTAALIESGAAVDALDDQSRTALHLAVLSGGETKEATEARRDIVRILLDKRASLTAADREGLLPLHLAAVRGRTELLALLAPKDAEIDARDSTGRTALHHAALGGHVAVMEFLIDRGANVDACDKAGETPLHLAARRCREKAAELLLDHGASINATNAPGQTALMLAAAQGPSSPELDAAIARFAGRLLEREAAPAMKDKEGRTALDYAVLREHKQTADRLHRQGGGR